MAKYGDKSDGNLSSLFGNKKTQTTQSGQPSKFVSSASLDSLGNQIESAGYVKAELENKDRVYPTVDFSAPARFAKYGSAEEYYKTSIERIYKTYPYDGSEKEKTQWSLSSSYLDNYILESEYPRTNGFVSFSPLIGGLASSFGNNPGTGNEPYTLATSPQYVSVKGGPNQASLPIYEQGLDKGTSFKNPEHKANFYDTANKRAKNITIDGTSGNTVEFWFRSDANVLTTKAFFDAWNNDGSNKTQPGSASYGRLLVESRFETSTTNFVDGHLFHLTYHSGTTGAERIPIFPVSVVGSPTVGAFNHFAVAVVNSGDATADKGLRVRTYLNGQLVDNKLTGSAVLEVTGAAAGGINANIGAYRTYPTEYVKAAGIAAGVSNFEGAGNLSASIDEVRFWKVARNGKQIGRNWFTQVAGGTNTDTANTDLGFYFKFNEGITGETDADKTILDYSGRISNGLYNNYSTTSRSTGSAIVLASAAETEFKDPILYPSHPEVNSYKFDAMKKGKDWDYRNPSMMFNMLPSWIQDEDSASNRNTTLELTQIMASYFDTLHLQVEEMRKVKTVRYISSSADTGAKPFPFSSKLLKNAGFVAPEIFANTDVVASLSHRDDKREFEKKLYDIKNQIYQNIYNNLTFINKSKGTTKSIRNLIRCFGIGDEIYKINMYADNAEYTLTNNFVDKTIKKTYADFNHVQRNNATVYTYKNTSESDNLGFITGSNNKTTGFDRGMAMTVESEIILPRKPELGLPKSYDRYFANLSSSLFGMHSAKIDAGSDAQTVMTWDSNDYANFQVYAVSDTINQGQLSSKSVRFVMKSYNSVLPTLTSSFYLDQYKDTKWNFAVRVKPKGYPNAGSAITGSTGKLYDVEFEGVSSISDIVINSFKATGTISNTAGLEFITQKKRMYAGAHRTNFTGSVRERSDALVSSCRYWADDITSDELKSHSIDPSSIGLESPEKNAFLFVTKYAPYMEVPRIKTLALNWEFNTVTGSDGSGQFLAKDSSYTITQDDKFQRWDRTSDLKNLLETNHDGRGDFFSASSDNSVSKEQIQAYKQQVPENINDSNMITVATTDDLTFTKNTLPIRFTFALEKSMYQTISEEMVKFFLASKEASALDNLVGNPVNRYRDRYKQLEKIRAIFFNTIGNTPDLEKYLNFYKWLDNSISVMVRELVPASAKLPNVSNIVEDHMLDRGGKYQSKFPTMESKEKIIEDAARGINELTYNWEHGHAPLKTAVITHHAESGGGSITITHQPSAVSTSAVGTVTFTSDTVNTSNYDAAQIHITSTDGTFKRYLLDVDNSGATGTTTGGGLIFVQLHGKSGRNAVALELQTAINHANGHNAGSANSKISISVDAGVVTLTQVTPGITGNTTIFNFINTNKTEVSGFSSGISANQDDNCFWWNERAIRDDAGLSSGDAGVDSNKKAIHSASVQVLNRRLDTTMKLNVDRLSLRRDLNKRQFVFAETPPATGETIKFDTRTFSKPVTCDDTAEINPQFKFKPQFKSEGDVVGSRFQGQMVSPVVFYSSSVGSQNTDPTGYFKTSQHLQDYYLETKEIPAQGPFTEQHVGGYQYRHTGINIGLATIRQEGWYTTTSVVGGEKYFIVYNPSAISTGYPRAGYSRDHIAKGFVNIKNIKNVTSSNNPGLGTTNELGSTIALGNYSHDYEIAQIHGRSINNKYFVENSGIGTGSAASTFISGMYDRAIPNRGKNKYVFVNRFSAPGGPETMGAGYLDVESESFSVYNALPFRNLSVRSPLRTMLTKHSAFGGYDSVLGNPSASFHKTQRNGAKRLKINGAPQNGSEHGVGLNLVTGTTFDNAFVQHMIPQSDLQYSWITASATNSIFGYAQPNKANASLASTDISFVSGSGQSSFLSVSFAFRGNLINCNTINNNDRFTVNVPAAAGGTGVNITIRFVSGTPSSGTSNEVQIQIHGAAATNVDRLVAAINGVSSSVIKYGAGSGDTTNGIAGISASEGDSNTVTVSATTGDTIGNSIVFTDVAGTMIAAGGASASPATLVGGGSQRVFGVNKKYQGTGIVQAVPTDFVGLNYHNVSDLTASTNTIGHSLNSRFVFGGLAPETRANLSLGLAGQSAVLNAINLNRNGAGGFSSWKQVRMSDSPLVKDMRKNNRLSFVRAETKQVTDPNTNVVSSVVEESLHSYTEPMISSKYKPLLHEIQLWNYSSNNGSGGQDVIIRNSYGNNLAYFTMTNTLGISGEFESMTDTIGFNPSYERQVYDDLRDIYITNQLGGMIAGTNPIKKIKSLSYRETVFPKESNTFLLKTRARENYGEASGSDEFNRPLGKARTFWRDDARDRLRSLNEAKNSMSINIVSGSFKTTSYEGILDLSCWPLEANYPMVEIAPTAAGGAIGGATAANEGEGSLRLPSTSDLRTLNGELSYNNWLYSLYKVPVQGLVLAAPSTLSSSASPTGSLSYEYGNIVLSGSDPSTANNPYTISHLNLIPKWTANITASRNPWFDSYEEYSNDIRRFGKDYSILPEFRMSDHIEYYLRNGFNGKNNKFMDLIGSSLSSTSSAESETSEFDSNFYRLYSHSDFMEHFEVLREDHISNGVGDEGQIYFPSKMKIKCKGIKKLLPYQGFYPALRTVQLGQMFSSSYGPYITGSYDTSGSVDDIDTQQLSLSSMLQPFFAPGIMFNTIKSGIAVDFPVISGSIESKTPLQVSTGSSSVYGYRGAGLCNFDPDWRLPFEALYKPNEFLPALNLNINESLENRPDAQIYHIWPNFPTASIAQSNMLRRYSPVGSEEHANWYDKAGYSRPTPNFAWTGQFDEKYNLAMNNFLAETVEFFLEGEQLTSFVSKPEKDFMPMVSGTTYYMDVVLKKTPDFKMYEGPDNLFNLATRLTASTLGGTSTLTSSVGARGMHYGPHFVTQKLQTQMGQRQNNLANMIGDPGPAPYTPPYFYGTSVARVSFKPHVLRENMTPGVGEKFTLSEIFSCAEVETVFLNENENSNGKFQDFGTSRGFATASAAYRNQMDLKSSVKLFERNSAKSVSYKPVVGIDGTLSYTPTAVGQNQQDEDVWIIETKFECPTLNFNNHNTDNFGDGSGLERNATTGMWRTLGELPNPSDGIFMELRNPFPQITEATLNPVRGSEAATESRGGSGTETRSGAKTKVENAAGEEVVISTEASLIDVCGFANVGPTSKRIGNIASGKTISEAIVAIPINKKGKFFNIDEEGFTIQKQNLSTKGVAIAAGDSINGIKFSTDVKQTSISHMIHMMQKYVVPPSLDFVLNKSATEKNNSSKGSGPFVMYMFEFNHQLSKTDLSLIWQNLMPDISVTAEQAESAIEHSFLTGQGVDFFSVNPAVLNEENLNDASRQVFPDVMRWMVFKVKKRAKNTFSAITSPTQDNSLGFSFDGLSKNIDETSLNGNNAYSYNWPYDFFSLVELAKVETTTKLKPKSLAIETVDSGGNQIVEAETVNIDK